MSIDHIHAEHDDRTKPSFGGVIVKMKAFVKVLMVPAAVGVCQVVFPGLCCAEAGRADAALKGVIGPAPQITWCSSMWKSSAVTDLELVDATPASAYFYPGDEFTVQVTVRNNAANCTADPGWAVILESASLELGSLDTTLRIGPGQQRVVEVSGTVPTNLKGSIEHLYLTARVEARNFIDHEPGNDVSDEISIHVVYRPILTPVVVKQELNQYGMLQPRVLLKNNGRGGACKDRYMLYFHQYDRFTGTLLYTWDWWWVPGDRVDVNAQRWEYVPGPTFCIDLNEYDYTIELLQPAWVEEGCVDVGLYVAGGGQHKREFPVVLEATPECP